MVLRRVSNHRRQNLQQDRSGLKLTVERLEDRRVLAAAIGESLWTQSSLTGLDEIDGGPSYLSAVNFDLFRLDLEALRNQLSDAPQNFQPGATLPVIELPNARGGFERFEVAYSPIYAAGFSDIFPAIRTYVGRSLDTPATTARLGLTYLGFHATVRSSMGSYEIDPYFHSGAGDLYTVYLAAGEFHARPEQHGERRMLVHPDDPWYSADAPLGSPPASGGGQDDGDRTGSDDTHGRFEGTSALDSGPALRIYRMGISANSGFSQLAGGTLESVQSSIVTSLNRINAITQNDISVSFQLIEQHY